MSSVTLLQMYQWALREQERLETWQRVEGMSFTTGPRHALDCAAGTVRLLDLVLSDTVLLDRLKVAAKARAAAAKAPASPQVAEAS